MRGDVLLLALWGALVPATVPGGELPEEAAEAIDELVSAARERHEIPGMTVAVGIGNELVFERGYGQADLENGVAATEATCYRTASIAKPMTAVIALKLAEEGKLDLDAPVQDYLRRFPEKEWPLTSRHLLSHLGGVRHYQGGGESSGKERHRSVRSALRLFADDPLLHEPGTKYHYTTYGYNLLGAVAEAAGDADFEELLDRIVAAPAGMTSICLDSQERLIPHRTRGYAKRRGRIVNAELHDTSMKVPGGGLLSTAGDLVRFAVAANTGRLVQPETVAAMWTRQRTKAGEQIAYGQGWRVSADDVLPRTVSHSGGQAGASAFLVLAPDSGCAVAVMCNLEEVRLEALASAILVSVDAKVVTRNEQEDGYRGIWYMNQPSGDEYVYKYSGGLGTYCAKHNPFAVYAPEVDKTFFCYGGETEENNRRLVHMVSFYDHETGEVPRPTLLLDKQTSDAHDNPVISLDRAGHVWIFSTSHGTARPSYLHRSVKPYEIDEFEQVAATFLRDGKRVPLDNFSYMQAWHRGEDGFACFFTRYGQPAARTICFMTSEDGVAWSEVQSLAAMHQGHYQISAAGRERMGSTFNFHPDGKGLNWRTNLYCLETVDGGGTWQTVTGEELAIPLTDPASPALVRDYQSEGLKVYLKDIVYDADDRPVILFITSKGYEAGPKNDPRTWTIARWTGTEWEIRPVTTSDNNYDMGSLWIAEEGKWRVIAPIKPGPQAYNPGGEIEFWESEDRGANWRKVGTLTRDSPMNHTYVRRPVNAHPGFYALWADGHGRQPSESSLYFCNADGEVFRLPRQMEGERAKPERVGRGN